MKPAKLRSSFLHGLPGPGHAVAIPRSKRQSRQCTSGRRMYVLFIIAMLLMQRL